MDKNDPVFELSDISAALGLLSRLPIRVNPELAALRGARSAWAYPVAGAVIGGLAGIIALIAGWLGFSPAITAALSLGVLAMLTGALHEDGLADTADGLWGGAEPARRLEIMADSRIGTYGVLALVITVLIRWIALTQLFTDGYVFWILIGVGALSRAPLPLMMQSMLNSRSGGLSDQQGKPSDLAAWSALAIGAAVGLITFGGGIFSAALVVMVAAVAMAQIATRKIGGQTGDILGATQQLGEVATLAVLATQI